MNGKDTKKAMQDLRIIQTLYDPIEDLHPPTRLRGKKLASEIREAATDIQATPV